MTAAEKVAATVGAMVAGSAADMVAKEAAAEAMGGEVMEANCPTPQ